MPSSTFVAYPKKNRSGSFVYACSPDSQLPHRDAYFSKPKRRNLPLAYPTEPKRNSWTDLSLKFYAAKDCLPLQRKTFGCSSPMAACPFLPKSTKPLSISPRQSRCCDAMMPTRKIIVVSKMLEMLPKVL